MGETSQSAKTFCPSPNSLHLLPLSPPRLSFSLLHIARSTSLVASPPRTDNELRPDNEVPLTSPPYSYTNAPLHNELRSQTFAPHNVFESHTISAADSPSPDDDHPAAKAKAKAKGKAKAHAKSPADSPDDDPGGPAAKAKAKGKAKAKAAAHGVEEPQEVESPASSGDTPDGASPDDAGLPADADATPADDTPSPPSPPKHLLISAPKAPGSPHKPKAKAKAKQIPKPRYQQQHSAIEAATEKAALKVQVLKGIENEGDYKILDAEDIPEPLDPLPLNITKPIDWLVFFGCAKEDLEKGEVGEIDFASIVAARMVHNYNEILKRDQK